MAPDTSRSLLKEARAIAAQDGVSAVLKAGLRKFDWNYEGYQYYLSYRYKRFRGRPCVEESELFRTLSVDPSSIVDLPTRRFDKWKNMGEIRSGDWDHPDGKFDDQPVVAALHDRFENETPWEELEFVQRAIDRVESGETTWNGCRTIADVRDRCAELDRLYERIRERGFRSQSEIHDADPKSILLSGSFDRSRTDIAVHIGRDGEFLFVDGRHRLTIAKVLGLESVPVRVVVRHRDWIEKRDEWERRNDQSTANERHPDVAVTDTN